MARKQQHITCSCGGRLALPLPKVCPHCGAEIVAVKHRIGPLLLPLIIVAAMFAALTVYVWWLATYR